jgi:ubiquinone/menaquinone biosynthesis C-methylase UbiE
LHDLGAHERAVAEEFTRAAPSYAQRTLGRFDHMDVVGFSRVRPHDTVAEIGAGTGNFLALFRGAAARLVAIDLTHAMSRAARAGNPDMCVVVGNGRQLPLASRSVDLVASAQTLHHVPRPLQFLGEMRRVCAPAGRVLIVDQTAPERVEQVAAMMELEVLRDPTHAACRPPSAFRILLESAGLRLTDERIVSSRQRFTDWMSPAEHPRSRIAAARAFIERRGAETGMGFERHGDDYVFERRRIMLLAERA